MGIGPGVNPISGMQTPAHDRQRRSPGRRILGVVPAFAGAVLGKNEMVRRPMASSRSLAAGLGLGILAACASMSVPGTAAAKGASVESDRFQPHRMLYAMKLGQATRGSNIVDAKGTMYYSFQAACDGWEVETRVVMQLRYGPGEDLSDVETTWAFKSFESYDGSDFRFEVEHNRDGAPIEILAGDANVGETGGVARFGEPAAVQIDLPPGTLFPTRHMAQLIDAAKGAETRYAKTVFDGASVNNPYEVNALLVGRLADPAVGERVDAQMRGAGKPVRVINEPRGILASLTSPSAKVSPLWRMRLAFFPTVAMGSTPEFEIEVDYREDGVAERMVQDFGSFTLELTPTKYEPLKRQACVKK